MAQMNQMQEAMFQQQKQLQAIHEQVERRHQSQLDSANKRLRRLEESMDGSTRPRSVSLSPASRLPRRHSVFIGKVRKEYDAETVEKSLFRFKFDQKFSGQQTEDIDAFLRSFERAVHSKEPCMWPLFLDRQLGGQAATSFQAEFPDLYQTEYGDAAKFLRRRYRPIRHLHNTFVSMLQIKQTASVSKYFTYLDTLLDRLSGVTTRTVTRPCWCL